MEHGVTQNEVDDILAEPMNPTVESDSSGRPVTFGWARTGRHLAVVWELASDDPLTIKPVTAYEVPPPSQHSRSRKKRKR